MEELLAKYFSEEASKDERSLVESWRSESKQNAEAFFDARSIWLDSQVNHVPSAQILEEIIGKQKEKRNLQFFLVNASWVKYAAAAVLIFAIGLLFFLNEAPELGFTNQTLSDGSTISLYRDSRIEIINFDDNAREVRVTGKAYFDIERDEDRPFIIRTENAVVKVLGTSFVVDTYEKQTEVLVESGLVELYKTDEDISVELSKGEMGLISEINKGIIKKNNDNLNYLSWKTKVLTFKDSQMTEVKQILEEVYGIKVSFENQDFKDCRLTAKFNKKKAKDAIEIISRTFNVEYEFSKNEAVIKGKGC